MCGLGRWQWTICGSERVAYKYFQPPAKKFRIYISSGAVTSRRIRVILSEFQYPIFVKVVYLTYLGKDTPSPAIPLTTPSCFSLHLASLRPCPNRAQCMYLTPLRTELPCDVRKQDFNETLGQHPEHSTPFSTSVTCRRLFSTRLTHHIAIHS